MQQKSRQMGVSCLLSWDTPIFRSSDLLRADSQTVILSGFTRKPIIQGISIKVSGITESVKIFPLIGRQLRNLFKSFLLQLLFALSIPNLVVTPRPVHPLLETAQSPVKMPSRNSLDGIIRGRTAGSVF